MGSQISVWSFAQAFRGQWFAAMSGGFSVPFTALAVFLDNKYQQTIFGCLAFGAVWYAAYTIWKIEREKVVALEASNDRSATKSQLQSFYASGSEIVNRKIPVNVSEQDWDVYVGEANRWVSGTRAWIQNNLGSSAVAKFQATNMSAMIGSGNGIHDKHDNLLTNMNKFMENLGVLIELDSYDKK